MWYIASEENLDYLAHHGIQGQKWGIRRYQNEDGSLTEEGRKRYGVDRPNKWAGENSLARMKLRRKDIEKAVRKEANKNKEKISEKEYLDRIKKEYEKIYKDKKLANIIYTMDVGHQRWRHSVPVPLGFIGTSIENAAINKGYNKRGYESPKQSTMRALWEYQNYLDPSKEIPEKYKQKYKQAF